MTSLTTCSRAYLLVRPCRLDVIGNMFCLHAASPSDATQDPFCCHREEHCGVSCLTGCHIRIPQQSFPIIKTPDPCHCRSLVVHAATGSQASGNLCRASPVGLSSDLI